jgi:hypothetical protein
MTVNGERIGQAITDSEGVAKVLYTIPESFGANDINVEFIDETGASIETVIGLEENCPAADLNCDGDVNAFDLAELLAAWGQQGDADLNGDGFVGAADLSILLSGWTG